MNDSLISELRSFLGLSPDCAVESQRKLWNESNDASSQDSKSFVPVHDKHPQESARAIMNALLNLPLESLEEDVPTVLSESSVEEGMNAANRLNQVTPTT